MTGALDMKVFLDKIEDNTLLRTYLNAGLTTDFL